MKVPAFFITLSIVFAAPSPNSATVLAAELTFAAQSSAPNADRIFESARIGPVITFIIVGIALLNPSEMTLGTNRTASTILPMKSNTFFAPLPKLFKNPGRLSVIVEIASTNTPASQSNAFEIASMIGWNVAIAFFHLLEVCSLPLIASLTFLMIAISAPSNNVRAATHGLAINTLVRLLQAVWNPVMPVVTPPRAPDMGPRDPVICDATSEKLSFNDTVATFADSVLSAISLVVLFNSSNVALYCWLPMVNVSSSARRSCIFIL